ncbi:MAG: amidohydrolase family protein, partial [Phototrophicaceae bacterium]
MADLILRGARVVDATQDHVADVAIKDGVIEAIGPDLSHRAVRDVDVSGLVLMPGGIDPHVHFNEPGRAEWEGIATGSEALARGGVTTFFDMPLNSSPVTTTAAAFDLKRQAIRANSRVHGYLWGGLIPGSVDEMMGMALLGAVGFKAFMSNSGLPEFPAVDDATLFAGMLRAAELGKIVAVHAENDSITAALAHEARSAGRVGVRAYLDSRPVIAELEAVQRALFFAGEARCKLHIVHVS